MGAKLLRVRCESLSFSTLIKMKISAVGSKLDNSKFYMGILTSFLVSGSDSNGRVALLQAFGSAGCEPPPHVHAWEHEIYYVMDGVLEFFVEDNESSVVVQAGESIFLPQGKAHAFYAKSPEFRVLLTVVASGEHTVALDQYIDAEAEQATSLELPEEAVTYTIADPAAVARRAEEHGMRILTPDQTLRLLPHYAGFGMNRSVSTGLPD